MCTAWHITYGHGKETFNLLAFKLGDAIGSFYGVKRIIVAIDY